MLFIYNSSIHWGINNIKNAQVAAAMSGGGFHPAAGVPNMTPEQQRQTLLVKRSHSVASPLAGSELNPQAFAFFFLFIFTFTKIFPPNLSLNLIGQKTFYMLNF